MKRSEAAICTAQNVNQVYRDYAGPRSEGLWQLREALVRLLAEMLGLVSDSFRSIGDAAWNHSHWSGLVLRFLYLSKIEFIIYMYNYAELRGVGDI